MSKYDDYVQPAEETEYLIEEERERWEDLVRWEEWISVMPTTDQGGIPHGHPLSHPKIEDPCLTDSQ